MKLTFCASSVELLHGVIESNSDRGEAHLPLKSSHQSVVQTPGTLCAYHGGDGAKHAAVPCCVVPFNILKLSLNLHKRMTLKDS